jgi:hypothetical protein
MKTVLSILFILSITLCSAQSKKNKVPSYFGIQIRPVFPTRFIGSPSLSAEKDGFETTISQKMGYSFGGTVRAGLTKTIALETGINYTQRNFDLTMAFPDSSSYLENDMTFIEYDIPINALMYVQLTEEFYMNASLGFALTIKPTDIGVFTQPESGYHTYKHTGLTRSKMGFDANANIGFEYRTEKNGFFYIGGSARVPFKPLFDMVADYNYQGINIRIVEPVDGSFLAIDFKYFFPNIKNKGPQFQDGPIQ